MSPAKILKSMLWQNDRPWSCGISSLAFFSSLFNLFRGPKYTSSNHCCPTKST